MSVQLILLEDVQDLGRIGDQVHVSAGYARNYLLPRKLAEAVTPGALKRIEAKKLRLQQEHEERINVAKAMADEISKLQLTIAVAAGESDKLYGSVGAGQISDALASQGIEVDRANIILPEPIRELGSHSVDIKLHAEVRGNVSVNVVRDDEKKADN